jgi:hypothetical protein
MDAIEDFWNIRLTRRRYVWEIFEVGKQDFLVEHAYRAAKEKVEALEKNITSIFSMLTTVFVLILTAAALFLGGLQLWSEVSGSGGVNPSSAAAQSTATQSPVAQP